MGDVFAGALFAVAFFMFAYKGPDSKKELGCGKLCRHICNVRRFVPDFGYCQKGFSPRVAAAYARDRNRTLYRRRVTVPDAGLLLHFPVPAHTPGCADDPGKAQEKQDILNVRHRNDRLCSTDSIVRIYAAPCEHAVR